MYWGGSCTVVKPGFKPFNPKKNIYDSFEWKKLVPDVPLTFIRAETFYSILLFPADGSPLKSFNSENQLKISWLLWLLFLKSRQVIYSHAIVLHQSRRLFNAYVHMFYAVHINARILLWLCSYLGTLTLCSTNKGSQRSTLQSVCNCYLFVYSRRTLTRCYIYTVDRLMSAPVCIVTQHLIKLKRIKIQIISHLFFIVVFLPVFHGLWSSSLERIMNEWIPNCQYWMFW